MRLGYLRISRGDEQTTTMQRRALREAGCERFFDEVASGRRWNRPELHRMLDQLRPGDVVVVWKLDRLSRSLKDLLHLFDRLKGAGAGFCSLTAAIDTTTAAGMMFMQMRGAFAEYERAMIRERTKAGMDAAHAAGRHGGRPPKLTAQQRAAITKDIEAGRKTAAEAAKLFGVSQSTVSRLVTQRRQADRGC